MPHTNINNFEHVPKCSHFSTLSLQYKFSELLTINCYFRNIIYLFFCFQGFFFVYFCTVCLLFALYSNMNICCFFFIKYTYVCQCFFLEKTPKVVYFLIQLSIFDILYLFQEIQHNFKTCVFVLFFVWCDFFSIWKTNNKVENVYVYSCCCQILSQEPPVIKCFNPLIPEHFPGSESMVVIGHS